MVDGTGALGLTESFVVAGGEITEHPSEKFICFKGRVSRWVKYTSSQSPWPLCFGIQQHENSESLLENHVLWSSLRSILPSFLCVPGRVDTLSHRMRVAVGRRSVLCGFFAPCSWLSCLPFTGFFNEPHGVILGWPGCYTQLLVHLNSLAAKDGSLLSCQLFLHSPAFGNTWLAYWLSFVLSCFRGGCFHSCVMTDVSSLLPDAFVFCFCSDVCSFK